MSAGPLVGDCSTWERCGERAPVVRSSARAPVLCASGQGRIVHVDDRASTLPSILFSLGTAGMWVSD